ncbi:MAG TPA: flavodoxin family protein [Dissulfurispiraceae bacterium]|nr:flavodoxin family protein [Dissulfurispiraceae bacterium]
MHIVAFNGSSRKDGNTAILINTVFNEVQKAGISTELVQLSGENLRGCIACYECFKRKNQQCAVTSDPMNAYIDKMIAADGIILGSPTYFADVSANMKALIERCGMVARANGNVLKRKVGASVVAVRRGGASHVFSSLNYFFLIAETIVVGSSYWNIGRGREIGEVQNDDEGIQTMKTLGENMAWTLQKICR